MCFVSSTNKFLFIWQQFIFIISKFACNAIFCCCNGICREEVHFRILKHIKSWLDIRCFSFWLIAHWYSSHWILNCMERFCKTPNVFYFRQMWDFSIKEKPPRALLCLWWTDHQVCTMYMVTCWYIFSCYKFPWFDDT